MRPSRCDWDLWNVRPVNPDDSVVAIDNATPLRRHAAQMHG
jgi:hypothetical protein